MRDFLKAVKALSDPQRVRIMKLLQSEKTLCVHDFQDGLAISQPAVSRHLRILTEAGFLSRKREGIWVYYFIDRDTSNAYVKTLGRELEEWLNEDPSLGEALKILEGREKVGRKAGRRARKHAARKGSHGRGPVLGMRR